MDISPTRYSLWENSDTGYSIYEQIMADLEADIRGFLKGAEEDDGSDLGALAATLHALVTLGEGTRGDARVTLDPVDLERRTMAAYRRHMADYPDIPAVIVADGTAFLASLFLRLRKVV